MSVDRYRVRKLHDQRRFDPLYIAAALAVVSYAVTIAIDYGSSDTRLIHVTLDVVTFGLFLPLLAFAVAWNETRPMLAGRVDYWREHGFLYRRLPGVICLDTAFRVVLFYAALPAFFIGGITTGFTDRALWTYGFLALFTALAYTALAIALALWSRTAFIVGVVYVFAIEDYASRWWEPIRWLSVREWAYAAAHVLPDAGLLPNTPVPTLLGWVFTYTLIAATILAASYAIIREHTRPRTELAQVMLDLRNLSATPGPAAPPMPVRLRRLLARRSPPLPREAPEPQITPWPANPPPPTPPDLIAPLDTNTDKTEEEPS